MFAERQAFQVAEEISGGLGIKERSEVVADFQELLSRGRFIFLDFFFSNVYLISRLLFAGCGRLDDKGGGTFLNRAKVGFFRLFRRLDGRKTNTVLIRIGV